MKPNNNQQDQHTADNLNLAKGISRKQAIKRLGKYAAVTALGSYIILNPLKAQAQSAETGTSSTPPDDTGNPPFGNGN